ncbi:Auxin-responsive protein [Nymphaea thermarum]|nr:Auxin-responsive protein [Nymphaea thermarum]
MLTKLGSCCFLLRAAAEGYGDGGNVRAGFKRMAGLERIPGDVKKGHFAVLAFNGSEPQRLVLPLGCLADPAFLKLLDKARDEYGFEQQGILTLPCHINELQDIFHGQLDQRSGSAVE